MSPLKENPVLLKEMRSRMRGGRAFVTLLFYVSFLCGVLYVSFLFWRGIAGAVSGTSGPGWHFSVGRVFFMVLTFLQALLVVFISPALTAGAITLEKEQRTFEMLTLTLLKSRDIVLGKMASSLSYVLLLMLSSLPVASLCFLFGSISPFEMFQGYLLLALFTFFFGSCGLFWSTVFSRTIHSTIFSYATALFFVIGIYFITGIFTVVTFVSVHPQGGPSFSAPVTFFARSLNTLNDLTPFSILYRLYLAPLFNMQGFYGSQPFPPFGHYYWNAVLFYPLTSCLLLKACTARVRRAGR